MWQTSGFTLALRLLYDDPTAGNGPVVCMF